MAPARERKMPIACSTPSWPSTCRTSRSGSPGNWHDRRTGDVQERRVTVPCPPPSPSTELPCRSKPDSYRPPDAAPARTRLRPRFAIRCGFPTPCSWKSGHITTGRGLVRRSVTRKIGELPDDAVSRRVAEQAATSRGIDGPARQGLRRRRGGSAAKTARRSHGRTGEVLETGRCG